MTLDNYLSRPGQTAASLAVRAGTSAASITRLLYGDQQPSSGMIKAIVAATDGEVTAQDLVFGDPRIRPQQTAA